MSTDILIKADKRVTKLIKYLVLVFIIYGNKFDQISCQQVDQVCSTRKYTKFKHRILFGNELKLGSCSK